MISIETFAGYVTSMVHSCFFKLIPEGACDMTSQTTMTIQGLALDVTLGWPHSERTEQQVVTLDVRLQFHQLPAACITDQLADTYCYDELVQLIRKHTSNRSYKLIEHLAHELFQLLKQTIHNARIQIQLTKTPPIHNVASVTFSIGDA